MRRLLAGIAAASAMGLPGLAVGQALQPYADLRAPSEGRLRLNYTDWESVGEEARRWEAPAASMRFGPADAQWSETRGGPRSARIGYGLSDRSELFVGVTKPARQEAFERSRDWKDIQDRKRRAYSIGVSTRW